METLDTLAAKIDALTASMEARFDANEKRWEASEKRWEGADAQFKSIDQRFVDLRTELLIRIEVVDTKVGLVLEQMQDLSLRDAANIAAHARLDQRIDNHELRLAALESAPPRKRNAP